MSDSTLKRDRPIVLLGAGGHARVLLGLLRALGHTPVGVCDPLVFANGLREWHSIAVLGDDSELEKFRPKEVDLIMGLGQTPRSMNRARLYNAWSARGYAFPPLVHPTAWVDPSVMLQDGVQIMAGAIVQPNCIIGHNTIINTNASVDHDCHLGSHVHVAPGATLCGSVEVGDHAFIGAGAVVIHGLRIEPAAIVGAGVTMIRNLNAGATLVGPNNRRL